MENTIDFASYCFEKVGATMGEKYTEAQKKATMKYLKEKTDSIQIRAPKGTKEVWRVAAEKRSKSLNQFIVETMNETINNSEAKENEPQ